MYSSIITSAIILLAKTETPHKYLFGAYTDDGEATSFLDLPEDRERFVKTLTDKQTVMGRKTLEATPLDFPDGGRICISRHPDKIRTDAFAAKSISQGIAIAKERATQDGQNSIYIIGGADIIKQCLNQHLLDEIKLTIAYGHQDDISNPIYIYFDLEDWEVQESSGVLTSAESKPEKLEYEFLTLKAKG